MEAAGEKRETETAAGEKQWGERPQPHPGDAGFPGASKGLVAQAASGPWYPPLRGSWVKGRD